MAPSSGIFYFIGAPARAKMWDSIKSSVDGEPGDMEISGHIDLDMRMKTENILPYINGEKRMLPKKSDLTFYNWDRGTAAYNSTDNFTVVAELPRLLLRHTGSDATLDITTSTPGMDIKKKNKRKLKRLRPEVPKERSTIFAHCTVGKGSPLGVLWAKITS